LGRCRNRRSQCDGCNNSQKRFHRWPLYEKPLARAECASMLTQAIQNRPLPTFKTGH
jgi:hypothetical protein